MNSVCVKKSPEGSVVIARGWGFVTRSDLMTDDEAAVLAARLLERADQRSRRVQG